LGPEGIGKRGIALEFAAALRCLKPRAGWACGECNECVRIAHSNHPNVRQFAKPDDSRDLPVELVRAICDEASLTRLEPGWRVFIVDDADRFNESSANAFLKTLEEPPAELTFVLLAANSAQMLTTIVSRCQSVRFSPLTPAELGQAVAGFEGLPAGEERELLLRVAQGSPGRVARMLELGVLKIAEDFIAAAARDPFKASEALGAALTKGLPADAGTEGQRERLRDILAVISAMLRERMVSALEITGVAKLGRAIKNEGASADALVVALSRIEELRERIDGNANIKLACDVLALGYPT
jgi:DNA polymerase-3 subunit delta'